MRPSTRTRLVVALSLIACGLAVTLAAASSLVGGDEPPVEQSYGSAQSTAVDDIAGATGAPVDPTGDVLGVHTKAKPAPRAEKAEDRDELAWCPRDEQCERGSGRGDAGAARAATLVSLGVADEGASPPCADTHSCVDRVVSLIPDVRDRPLDLPKINECTSAIGGEALCVNFDDGNYLVGDAPVDDGQAELGFCGPSGYYYVSGPSLDGAAGAACPDDGAAEDGPGRAGAPKPRECTSGLGGEATCFDFGHGKYIVFDSQEDGEGEFGFCTGDSYYYVSGSSGEADAGGKCPDAA